MEYLLTICVFLWAQGAEYEVLDDSQEHWWKVKDENGYIIFLQIDYKYFFTHTSFEIYVQQIYNELTIFHLYFLLHAHVAVIKRQSRKIISYSVQFANSNLSTFM